jgi:hypothetical protein
VQRYVMELAMLCITYNICEVDLEQSRQSSSVTVISRLESVGQDSDRQRDKGLTEKPALKMRNFAISHLK